MGEVSIELKPDEGEVGVSALLTLLQTHRFRFLQALSCPRDFAPAVLSSWTSLELTWLTLGHSALSPRINPSPGSI